MTLTDLRLEPSDPRTASDDQLRAVALHREVLRHERLPDDPPWQIETLMTEMRHVEPDEDVFTVNAWDGSRVVGHGALFLPLRENTHLAFVELSVQAPHRQRGLGRRLLAELTARAETQGRRTLIGGSSDRLPDGEAFLRRLGADAALATHMNQLDLAELDRALMERWVQDGEARATDYRVWLNSGPYPQERRADIADLWNVMNTAPRGDLDMQDWQMSVERLEHWEEQLRATGERRVTAFAEHRATGQLVGYSELFWQPERHTLLFQGATGVRPEHRRHGLGRWLKAANLLTALNENPEARVVRTGNADVNAAMLGINYAMGFKPFMAQTDWQIQTDKVRAYLNGQA